MAGRNAAPHSLRHQLRNFTHKVPQTCSHLQTKLRGSGRFKSDPMFPPNFGPAATTNSARVGLAYCVRVAFTSTIGDLKTSSVSWDELLGDRFGVYSKDSVEPWTTPRV
ncbi:hypothetical protein J6590_029646 [Homalodisca vitripennis]|nr:hypothetical protein J6590_029646 [Homalodisca vitripennis]